MATAFSDRASPFLPGPDPRLRALGRDLARFVAEDMADDEGTAAPLLDLGFDHQLLALLRGALEGALGRDQRRALLPLPAAQVVALQAGGEEQPVGRLVAPAEIGRVVDDAGGVAVAPFDGDGVVATSGMVQTSIGWPLMKAVPVRPATSLPSPRTTSTR